MDKSVVEDSQRKIKVVCFGFILNPFSLQTDEKEIIEEIINGSKSWDSIIRHFSTLSGRFVLIIHWDGRTIVLNDACSLRSVYYFRKDSSLIVASQVKLIGRFIHLESNKNYASLLNSSYYKTCEEFYLPPSSQLYENVERLLPNHFLDLNLVTQHRYWPFKEIVEVDSDFAVTASAAILKNLMATISKKFNIAFPLTAGYDSRTIFAASKDNAQNFYYYTLQFRKLNKTSDDIKIPLKMVKTYDLKHDIIDCQMDTDPGFWDIYRQGIDLPHADWAKIAYGASRIFPQNYISIKGACSEIVKQWYQKRINKNSVLVPDRLVRLEPGWNELPFVQVDVGKWIEQNQQIAKDFNIELLDMFVWEVKVASWQSQNQSEWDVFQEVFSPFNTRPLLEIMLGASSDLRQLERPILFERIIEYMWADLLKYDLNPISFRKRLKTKIQSWLVLRGLYFR